MEAGRTLAATLCYICAGNIDKMVEIWSKNVSTKQEGKTYVGLLQDLMEKTMTLVMATGQKQFSASLCKLVEKYAEIVASQGLLVTAMEYLKFLGNEELTPELVILRDCIALSTEPESEVQRSTNYENSKSQTGAVNGANQPSYYEETAPSQVQQNIPTSPYVGNYREQINPTYGRGYGAPIPYQPALQPNIFLPSQAPQMPQVNLSPPPVTSQPAVKPFVPATPPTLRAVSAASPHWALCVYSFLSVSIQLYPVTSYYKRLGMNATSG